MEQSPNKYISNADFANELKQRFKQVFKDVEDSLIEGSPALCEYEVLKRMPGSFFVLWIAVENNFTSIIAEFLKCGFPVDEPLDVWGNTLLHVACWSGSAPIVKLLLMSGADINVSTNVKSNKYPGFTPLHFASFASSGSDYVERYSYFLIVKLLLELHPNVNAQDGKGKTALFYAVKNECRDITKELLKYGSDTAVKDNDGFTVFDIATSEEIKHMLETY